jgi:hypothetical protein
MAEGLAALKAIGNDAALPAAIRAEALYNLGLQASSAGKTDEVAQLEKQIADIDSGGLSAQRLRLLQTRKAASPGAAPSAVLTPAAPSAAPQENTPSVTLSLPSKK